MLSILRNRTYRHLFLAQIIALLGTGLATVALALLAYELAGGAAGAVLGTALAIKMIAYIGIAPIVGAFADQLPRRSLLIAMDVVRASVAIVLPFVDQIWQIYLLIFIMQSASAAFTPTFQATIPDILPDERDYTRALSLSRLAYDTENLVSPMLAAALLSVMSFHWLFSGTAIGFIASALLVSTTVLERSRSTEPRKGGIYTKTTRGMRIYLKTPRLQGLLALTLAAAAASAMVIVNTVVIVRDILGLGQRDVAFAFAAYGGGSILAALILPRLLDRISDRTIMIGAAASLSVGLAGLAVGLPIAGLAWLWPTLLGGWFILGIAYSMSVTPTGRLLRRSANAEDRPALFAAQFALSHVCWLIAYPVVGWLGAEVTQEAALGSMAILAGFGSGLALWLWPRHDPQIIAHSHDELAPDHPHLQKDHGENRIASHPYVIDELHEHWPNRV
ncbi:MFS transporter [Parasphingopyxis lamellibrachiae]|uniref:H+ antiporter protein n=1 Tax=Parasphingopyxis lamellibrachiae TaxID=680125 RepID=A0A3D9FFY3_9SPHN|nr:MFS transporter [Parasphingopyxis lamellibrachiae]RED16689.1 H+ antiporter protein [Parasphingopyxis lamellibrachiae]